MYKNFGWTCPKCGRSYSPTVQECLYCNDNRIKYAGKTIPNYEVNDNIYDNEWWKNLTLLNEGYYEDEDLWGKPL